LYLKALEIQGFKSFPDKTVLTFNADITAIVGPNGSGKSNISDAIRWVMGEQSTRALRGGKMEDVIFGGTARRKQLGFAEVSLVLDNTGRFFPLEESEVMVTRRYYRSGESEYFINRRAARLKDVNELFMDTGLGRDGYSMIGQGRIDEILSVKSGDRREVFEEAAGISRFRHRKEEAERKLERTQENLVRVSDKIDELELQVEPLRAQAEKARKYLLLRDEMRGLEISVWMEQLDKIHAGTVKLTGDYDSAVRQKEEARTALEKLYASAEHYAGQMRQKDVEAEGIRFQLMKRQADANECESAIAVLKSSIEHNAENAQRVRQELDQQEGRTGSLAAQIREGRTRLEGITEKMNGLRGQLEEQNAAAKAAEHSAGALGDELEALRRKEAVETASAAEARQLLSALSAAAQELFDRDASVRRELAAGAEKLAASCTERDAAEKAHTKAEEDRKSLLNVISGYALRAEARQKKARDVKEKRVRLQMEENALASRIHMLAEMEKVYEGYSKAVKLVMGEARRGNLRGIRGPVASLLQVPDSYTVAIEVALGGAMQHIVVDREEDGKNAIGFLRRRDGGRATFLPRDAVRPSNFRDRAVEREPGFVGMGDALITFAPDCAGIFSNLLGRVVIAETLDAALAIARKFSHRFRIVTLDGQVLNPGGSMTGGSVSRNAGILSRQNELARLNTQAEDIRKRLSQAAKAVEEADREAAAAGYELENARAQQRELEDHILRLSERCAHYAQGVEELEGQKKNLRAELEQIGRRVGQTEADTDAARARIEQLEGSAAALRAESENKTTGRQEIRTRADAIRQEIAALNVQLAALEAEQTALRKSMDELENLRRDIAGDRTERERLLAGYEAKNTELSAQIGEKQGLLEKIQAENRTQNEAIGRINEEKLTLEQKRNETDRASRDKNTELLNMEREVSVLEQKKASAAVEEKQILDKLWETYELSHEAAKAQRQELESISKAQRRIGELRRSISGLGNVNLDAVEEFQRVNERYTYLTGQRDDVIKSKKELEGIIADITAEMKTIFSEQFASINAAFAQTFQELFGGGKAALELEDEKDILNCDIEIRVQPPGKALKTITLLSGGEKAFVAIALYFAILKVRPTPFCVMDEIEAALDDANVVRYARYLRQMSGRTQFLVITHRRGTMEEADVLYGVTMQEQGVSRLLTINLNELSEELGVQ
jgi:chromosome segregation protein